MAENSLDVTGTRFNKSVKIGCVVSIRSAESFDRFTVLKQSDYRSGRYGTQYDIGVFSPFFDLKTEDLWRTNALLDLDFNEIYDMYWDAGVPLANMRIGSPLNSHAGDSVKLYKVLNPDTYGKMTGRLDGVDFVSSYGGVFNNGFKYIQLDQPKPFYEGVLTSQSLVDAINEMGLDYVRRNINASIHDKENTAVRNSASEPVKMSDNIRMHRVQSQFIREQAAQKCEAAGDEERAAYFRDNIPLTKTWYDYAVQLANEAEPMYQKSWLPKMETSLKHWAYTGSAVPESSILGLRVLDQRADRSFGADELGYEEDLVWGLAGYTDISRKPILKLYRYLMDCPQNLTRAYIENIVERWDDGGKQEFLQNDELRKEVLGALADGAVTCGIPGVDRPAVQNTKQPTQDAVRMWVIGDTEKMDKVNAESNRAKDPFSGEFEVDESRAACITLKPQKGIDGVQWCGDECDRAMWGVTDAEGNAWSDWHVAQTLLALGHDLYHDAVRDGAGSWKRFTIAALRGDVKLTYMSFGQSSEEKMIRANAEAAFATTKAEQEKKIKEYESLKAKMDKEKSEYA